MATSQADRMRRELKKEVSDYDVLQELLSHCQKGEAGKLVDFLYDRFVDIAVEQLVIEGHFSIWRFLTIDTDELGEDGSLRIKAKVSDSQKLLRKAYLAGVEVDRDNWRDLVVAIRKEMRMQTKRNSDLYNPLIDEED